MAISNIANLVKEMASKYGASNAVIIPRNCEKPSPVILRKITFAELQTSIDDASRGMLEIGIRPGMRVVVMVRPGIEFFQTVFSLFQIGATVVAIDPGLGMNGIGACVNEAQPDAFIGIPLANLARKMLGWGKATIKHCISVGFFPFAISWSKIIRLGQVSRQKFDGDIHDPAAILFTSGSTGISKGVVYQHDQFHAQVQALKSLYAIEPGEIDLPTFPLFGLFSPAMGMTTVIPEMDFTRPASANPEKIAGAIRHFQITNLFASPALLRRLSLLPEGLKFPSIKRVLSAGAPVPATEIANLAKRLNSGIHVFTPYGATEALPLASIGSDEILVETTFKTAIGFGVCVGKPVPGVTIRIMKIDDEPIQSWDDQLLVPGGTIGEIVASGPMVTKHYMNRPDQESRAKMKGLDGQVYHRMGDLGYMDLQGRLWFCGRKSQRIIQGNKIHHTVPCEGIFDSVQGVFRSALVGVGPVGMQEPVVCIQKKDPGEDEARLREMILGIAKQFDQTKDVKKVLFHPSFPMDIRHNSKIRREDLSLWAHEVLA